jgi:hypothetical protein
MFQFDFFKEEVEASNAKEIVFEKKLNETLIRANSVNSLMVLEERDNYDFIDSVAYINVNIFGKVFKVSQRHFQSGLDEEFDIVNGKYEGGYKIWECSLDLSAFILENISNFEASNLSILELGCGHALPGIVFLQSGCKSVMFSDLNSDVIQAVTLPNIFLNCDEETRKFATCYSGDWNLLSTKVFRKYRKVNLFFY